MSIRFKGYYFTPRLWPTVMTIPILIILCLLGNWQVERLYWKLDIIDKLETRYNLPAKPIPSNIENEDDWVYRHVMVSGRFLYTSEMPLFSIGPNGKPGYDLYTPLQTRDGKYVIINRGWVPEDMLAQSSRPETISATEVQVTGVLRKRQKKHFFVPENDLAQNIWYYSDLEAMAKTFNQNDIFPMFIYADNTSAPGAYPIGSRSQLKPVNNHLDYAMTWYGLAIVLLVIYFIFNIRKYKT